MGPTVYDRTKRTGYMMGQGHAMGPAMQEKAEPEPEPEDGPPNLRDAGVGPDSCSDCRNFDGSGRCEKFDAEVTPNQVCDAFEAANKKSEDEAEGEGKPSYEMEMARGDTRDIYD